MGQARALWTAREAMMSRSRVMDGFSQAALLSFLVVVVSIGFGLNQIVGFDLHAGLAALPAVLLPLPAAIILLLMQRRIHIHIGVQLPNVRLPFDAVPVMHRLSLQMADWLAQAKSLAATPPITLLQAVLGQGEAMRSVTDLAQRMSRTWLHVRAVLEAIIEHAGEYSRINLDLSSFPLHTISCHADQLTRQPLVVVLRC